jgi:pachytene checkpoint protein 2
MASSQLVFPVLVLFHKLTSNLVEVRLSPTSTARFDTIRNAVHQYILRSFETIALPSKLDGWENVPVLASSVEQISACESSSPTSYLPIAQASLQIHVYQPTDGDFNEGFSTGSSNDGEELMAASVCELPSRQWEGLWDSLIFPDDTKSKLLDYIYATVLFSDANVDCEFLFHNSATLAQYTSSQYRLLESGRTLAWPSRNRKDLTLPSSCTKTLRAIVAPVSTPSRCLKVAYPATNCSYRYPHSRLLEINSHSLFSRWFSESGKLVQKLFGSVMELVEDEDTFVVVLIGAFLPLTLLSSYLAYHGRTCR